MKLVLIFAAAVGVAAYAHAGQKIAVLEDYPPKPKPVVGTYQLACAGTQSAPAYIDPKYRCWRINTATGEVVKVVSE